MTVKDRTSEFHSAVESLLSRSGPSSVLPADKVRLLNSSYSSSSHAPTSKTEFTKAAAQIGREINSTVAKLQKLTRLAKRKSLFDDRPVEINELIYIIKQDIAKINNQIAQLAAYQRKNGFGVGGAQGAGGAGSAAAGGAGGKGNRQVLEHSSNVITSLQTKLASTSNEFKNILEIRTQNMKDQKERRDQYSFSGTPGGLLGPGGFGSSDSPLYNPERRNTPAPAAPDQGGFGAPAFTGPGAGAPAGGGSASGSGSGQQDGSVVIDFGSGSMGAGMGMGAGGLSNPASGQMQLVQAPAALNMEIIESRSQAIESIEATIAELGQVYQNFATMVASQREMVQRIDENVLDVEVNVTGAHSELMKYYQNISSNRWLMAKGAFMVWCLPRGQSEEDTTD
ncbi:cis-Golgi t-SNARE syntaxin [Borealophlyctis nickersoniae]|nr:cis-Golgi t-SNARE syntaxin [Borealophlyctis nickersoniae]